MAKLTKEQLARLTPEQKIELIEALNEKRRRKLATRLIFKPHEGQVKVITSDKKVRVVTAGNGSGKTATAVNLALWAVEGFNPVTSEYTRVPARVYVVLDDPSKVEETWLPELKKWTLIDEASQCKKHGKPYYTEIVFPNGSFIKFLFHNQEDLRVESIEMDFVIFDEPPPRKMWIGMLRGGRTKGRPARYIIIGTPIAQAWLREYYNEWAKGRFPDTEFFSMHTESNRENLADGYIEDFSRHLTDREKRTRLEGAFFNTDGLALASLWRRTKHIVSAASLPPNWREWPAVLAMDPHPNKPTVGAILVASPDGRLLYAAEREAKEVPRDWARWVLTNWKQEFNIVDYVCDSSGNADFTGGEGFKSFIEVWKSEGIRIRGTTYDEKSDTAFLERLQEALYIDELKPEPLQRSQLQILDIVGETGIVNDIENVGWQPQKGTESYKPKLEISNRDYLAVLKYALATNHTYKRPAVRRPSETSSRTSTAVPSTKGFVNSTRTKPVGGNLHVNWRRRAGLMRRRRPILTTEDDD